MILSFAKSESSLFDPYDPTEVWRVSDEMCMEQGLVPPHTVRSCGGGVCNFGIWTTMDEGVRRREKK